MGAVNDVWSFLTTAENWTGTRGIWTLTRAHVHISAVAAALAVLLAVPPAVFLAHRRMAPVLSVAVANIGRAIPSFAIIALVFPISIQLGLGLGFWPTCVALVALGIPPLFTNTYAGIAGTSPEAVEAARGIGMTELQLLRKVELPTALPLIIAGFRISSVQIVATATLGALVGYRCLGTLIIEGLAQPTAARDRLLTGAVLVAALAMTLDFVIDRIEPHLVPWMQRVR
jgi:osmoprotectant transport system permease protein